MAITRVFSYPANWTSPNPWTTGTFDSTGSDLIVVVGASYNGSGGFPNSVSDNKGNTYTAMNKQAYNGGTAVAARMFYCIPVAGTGTGSGHTVTNDYYGTITVIGYSGVKQTSPLDVDTGSTGASTNPPSPTISPSEDNELLLTLVAPDITAVSAVSLSFTIVDNQTSAPVLTFVSHAIAELIETSAASKAPVWTGSITNWAITVASFKAATAASSIKTVDGLAVASVKTVDGLAIASVKNIQGLTNV